MTTLPERIREEGMRRPVPPEPEGPVVRVVVPGQKPQPPTDGRRPAPPDDTAQDDAP